MKKITVFNQNKESALATVNSLIETELPYKLTVARSLEEVEMQTQSKCDLLILEQNQLSAAETEIIPWARKNGFISPILVCLDNIPKNFYAEQRRIHFLLSPFTNEEIMGVIKKLVQVKEIPQQRFRRFNTNEDTSIENLSSGHIVDTTVMYNVSQGGAYCEYLIGAPKDAMSIGDLVRMRVHLPRIESLHHLNARVVWKTHAGRYSGLRGVGLQFLTKDEIYRQLMDR